MNTKLRVSVSARMISLSLSPLDGEVARRESEDLLAYIAIFGIMVLFLFFRFFFVIISMSFIEWASMSLISQIVIDMPSSLRLAIMV